MMAWREGRSVDADITVREKSLVWGFRDHRVGQIRFTVKLDEAGRWFEIGEISRDGTSWNKFFEMTLKRVGGSKFARAPSASEEWRRQDISNEVWGELVTRPTPLHHKFFTSALMKLGAYDVVVSVAASCFIRPSDVNFLSFTLSRSQ